MKLKDYSADSVHSSGNRPEKRSVSKDKGVALKASLTMSKFINQVKHDADTLLTLDELYTALSSLVMLAEPDADYNGIRDANRLNQIVDGAVHRLPAQYQALGQSEVNTVRTLLSKDHFREANTHVMRWAKVIGEHIQALQEPPQDVQAVLSHSGRLK